MSAQHNFCDLILQEYDSCELVKKYKGHSTEILIDQVSFLFFLFIPSLDISGNSNDY